MQENLLGSEVLSYFAYVTVTCAFIGQPLIIAAQRNPALLNGVAALVD